MTSLFQSIVLDIAPEFSPDRESTQIKGGYYGDCVINFYFTTFRSQTADLRTISDSNNR